MQFFIISTSNSQSEKLEVDPILLGLKMKPEKKFSVVWQKFLRYFYNPELFQRVHNIFLDIFRNNLYKCIDNFGFLQESEVLDIGSLSFSPVKWVAKNPKNTLESMVPVSC